MGRAKIVREGDLVRFMPRAGFSLPVGRVRFTEYSTQRDVFPHHFAGSGQPIHHEVGPLRCSVTMDVSPSYPRPRKRKRGPRQ